MKLSIFKCVTTAFVLLTLATGGPVIALAQSADPAMRELLRFRIETGGEPLSVSVDREVIHAAEMLPLFYERRAYEPAWTDRQGGLPRTGTLLDAIRQADREGLRSDDYHIEKIETILSELHRSPDPRQLVDLDILLTDAFLIYGSHLVSGRINPEKVHSQWIAHRREADLVKLLELALDSDRIAETLHSLLPAYAGYRRLRHTLAQYRKYDEAGGWPVVPSGSRLRRGDRGERVALLRKRLAAEGFLTGPDSRDPTFFDSELEQALIRFQQQNSLESDGILGDQSLQALNISAGQRVRQVVVNMERWRWLPRELGNRYVLVNIASFNLEVVEQQTPVLKMRVVAGKPFRKTPVFSDKITYLVFNPYWGVPQNIAKKDILPKLKKDPEFLTRQKFRVLRGWGADSREIDPRFVDWKTVVAANLPYWFKQDPGPQNALGRIKFMFPNKFDVYLHDTPSKELFAKARRDFSSGCIRIEKPFDLAEYLLKDHPGWPPAKIRSAAGGSDFSTQTVKLVEPVNIHILYWTVWVGEDAQVHFGPDIYDRDTAVNAALQSPPPGTPGEISATAR